MSPFESIHGKFFAQNSVLASRNDFSGTGVSKFSLGSKAGEEHAISWRSPDPQTSNAAEGQMSSHPSRLGPAIGETEALHCIEGGGACEKREQGRAMTKKNQKLAAVDPQNIQDVEFPELERRNFPPALEKRVQALREQQDALDNLQEEYKRERLELEAKFIAQKAAYFEKRGKVLAGEADAGAAEGDATESGSATIPDFWLDCFSAVPEIAALITEEDADALAHLVDVACSYNEDYSEYTLSFHFEPNEYFTNSVLTKRYEVVPNLFDESLGLAACDGCEVNWKPGKNLTVKEIKKKQKSRSGKNKGQVRTVTKTVPKPSFFAFFKSVQEGEDSEQPQNEEEGDEYGEGNGAPGPRATLSIDEHYDVGHMIRVLVIPDAILLYTGEKEMVDLDNGMQQLGVQS